MDVLSPPLLFQQFLADFADGDWGDMKIGGDFLQGELLYDVGTALQEFFGGEFGHILRHLDTRLVELQQFYLFVAAFGAEQQAEGLLLASLLTLFDFVSGVRLPLRGTISWASSQRRYNSIWPLYCALNLPSFKSMAIRRCNLRW